MTESRTPTWWRSIPTWTQFLILTVLLPGVVLHELTHALVAQPWGSWTLDWDEIAVEIVWSTDHPAPRVASHLAPLFVGYGIGIGAVGVVMTQGTFSINTGLLAFLATNWLVFTLATVADLRNAAQDIRLWRRSGKDVDTNYI